MIMLLVLALAMGAGAAAPDNIAASKPRVYVYTEQAPGGVVSEEEQGRLDSVRDLRDVLRRNAKIVLVSDVADADIVVEVTGREKRDVPGGGFGGKVLTQPVEMILRLRAKSGDTQTEIKGVGQVSWGRATKDAAGRLMKWIARVAPQKGF